jgi:predicted ATPase/DNA-binding CsgD family transcriptional regulator
MATGGTPPDGESHAAPGRYLSPVMIGRDQELSWLTSAWQKAGELLVVRGPAGVGKSRLIREFSAWVKGQGGLVLTGRCTPTAFDFPLRPVREALLGATRSGVRPGPGLAPFLPALATLVPEWAPSPPPAEPNPVVIAEGVLRFMGTLVRGDAAPVLMLEDVQWADRETLALLDYLADNLAGAPHMIITALRTGEDGAGADLVAELLSRRVATPIDLLPLDETQIGKMVAACLADRTVPASMIERVAARSDGLPFFVEELLATVADTRGETGAEVPASITSAVEQRVRSLPGATALLVRHAAVLGRQFDWELAAAAAGSEQDATPRRLRDAVRAQLLEVQGSGFRFRHALTVDAILDGLLPTERQQIAANLLAALTQRDPQLAGEHCQLAARLAGEAGDPDHEAEHLIAAANRAAAEGSLVTAEALAQRARSRRPREADLVLLDVLTAAGQPDRVAETGRRLLDELRDPLTAADVRLAMARAAMAAGRWSEAQDHLVIARKAVGEDPSRRARIAAAVAATAMGREDTAAALPLAEQALHQGEETNQPAVQCEALEVIGRVERGRHVDAASAAFERAHRLASEHNLAMWRIRAMQELGTIDMFQTLATARLEEARRDAIEAGALATGALVDLQLAAVHNERGDPNAALTAARHAADTARRLGLATLPMSLAQQAMAHARSGHRARMEQAAAAARATGQDVENVDISLWGNAFAIYHLGRNDLPAAAAALDKALEGIRDLPGVAYPFPGLWALIRTVLDEKGEQARDEVRALPFDTPVSQDLLAAADAVAAGRTGDPLVAAALFETADAALACYEGGFRRSLMWLLVAHAAWQAEWGDPAQWLRQALVTFDACGLRPLTAACRSALRRIGEPVPRAPRTGGTQSKPVSPFLAAMGITGRELEVLARLAAGRSNRAISEELFLSVRTVEKHVERILVKTGVSRAGLAALAARAGVEPAA